MEKERPNENWTPSQWKEYEERIAREERERTRKEFSEMRKPISKRYYEKHRDEILERQRRRRKENPEHFHLLDHRRYLNKKAKRLAEKESLNV